MMNMCRTCLKTPASKDMSQLEKGINEDNKNYFHIMEFCLDIKVIQDSKITTKLCHACYRKIISFYKFKALTLKNDVYLKSLDPSVSTVDQKLSIYVDKNGIKHENLLDEEVYGPVLLEDYMPEVKIEIQLKNEDSIGYIESNEELPSEEQKANEGILNVSEEKAADVKKRCTRTRKSKNIPDESREKNQTSARKKRCRPKKVKQPNKNSKKDYEMCEECGKSFRNLKEHIISHQPKDQRKMLQCKVCPKLFLSKHGQRYHYKTAHLGMKSKCDICNKAHKLLAHNRAALPFGCVSCPVRFLSRSHQEKHMTCHTKVCAYECDYCQKKFGRKENLASHILEVHAKVKNFQCEFCSKGFFQKSKLKIHLRSHTKERPYKCEECGKSFSVNATLKSHRLVHSGVKSFHCQVCGMSFVKPANLKVHMVTHTKEKKFPCQYCGIRFGRCHHRRRHERNAHEKHLAND